MIFTQYLTITPTGTPNNQEWIPARVDKSHNLYTLQQTPLFPKAYNEIVQSNPDANGNYQTVQTKLNGAIQNTLAITWDANGNPIDVVSS